MSKKSPFYITTALSYPNGPPHIGHAYEIVTTDIIARFMRLAGREVFFLTGTDDYGQKMYRTAQGKNMSPQAFADKMAPQFRRMGEQFLCEPNDFIRTSEPRHHRAVQFLWQQLQEAGAIFRQNYEGWYSVAEEAYVSEEDSVRHADGRVTDREGRELTWLAEPCYYFRLSAWQKPLLEFYDAHPQFLQPPTARREVLAFVRRGLKDIAISRSSFPWGVPVPNDSEHIVYVWLDALTNYISALGYPDTEAERWKTFWPASLHVIGKDITRFHAIFWLAFLLAAKLPLPQQIFAHGWFLSSGGEKMSKSRGNVLNPADLLAACGAESLRFFLAREIPFGRDGQISERAVKMRYNAELANDLGNLAQRCLTMVQKNLGGTLPRPQNLEAKERALLARCDGLGERCAQAMETYALARYLEEVMALVAACNRYFAAAAPWTLKSEPERCAAVLYVAAECLRQSAILLQPVLPTSMARLLDLLGVEADAREFAQLGERHRLAGGALPPPQILFPRQDMPESERPA